MALAPWVAFLIVPLFGFANAGVSLARHRRRPRCSRRCRSASPPGLFLGKQVGIFGGGRGSRVALGLAGRPRGATWLQVYGVALLCGIGFTMSLFIGGLAFRGRSGPRRAGEARHAGGLVAVGAGGLCPAPLRAAGRQDRADEAVPDQDERDASP